MKIKFSLKTIFAYLTCIFVGFLWGRGCGVKTCPEFVSKTDTVYVAQDTIWMATPLPEPKIIEKFTEVPVYYRDTVTMQVDTARIIAGFLSMKHYDQVLLNSSKGFIRLEQGVSMNEITYQNLTYRPPDQIVISDTRYVKPEDRFRFTAGVDCMFGKGQFDVFAKGGVMKSKYHFTIGYSMGGKKSLGINYIF